MKTSNARPATFNHSAARPYVSKLEEYAHSVAGHGKQHVGFPGNSIGVQSRPDMTLLDVSQNSYMGSVLHSQPPELGNKEWSRNGATHSPVKGDVVFAMFVHQRVCSPFLRPNSDLSPRFLRAGSERCSPGYVWYIDTVVRCGTVYN